MNRLELFCWNQSGQKQLEQHKLSILVLSIKLALKHYCLTSSEWFRLFTAAGISDPDAQTAQLVRPKLLIDQEKTPRIIGRNRAAEPLVDFLNQIQSSKTCLLKNKCVTQSHLCHNQAEHANYHQLLRTKLVRIFRSKQQNKINHTVYFWQCRDGALPETLTNLQQSNLHSAWKSFDKQV